MDPRTAIGLSLSTVHLFDVFPFGTVEFFNKMLFVFAKIKFSIIKKENIVLNNKIIKKQRTLEVLGINVFLIKGIDSSDLEQAC